MVVSAFRDGIHRVRSAPALLAGVFLLTFAMALPLALTVRGMLSNHLGGSLVANTVADHVDYEWWQEFRAQAAGLGTTFSPSIIGFAAVLDTTSSLIDAQSPIAPVSAALTAYIVVWAFLLGGIIDRYARRRPTRAHGFFAASGVFFMRFLRLAIAAALVYGFLFVYVHRWLFDVWYANAIRPQDVERTAFLWRLAMYAIFGLLLLVANVVFDYAKIRAVVEDRRSMIGAIIAGARFVIREPRRVAGMYVVNTLLFLAVIALWALIAPNAGGAGLSMWSGFVVSQIYLMARLFAKLTFVASQTALFQASLAHAGYTAAPAEVWPESPAAEAISIQD
jgi:hypothetical protein